MDGTLEVLLRGVAAPLLAEDVEASLSALDTREAALNAGLEVLACGELSPREAPLLCMPAWLLPGLLPAKACMRPA